MITKFLNILGYQCAIGDWISDNKEEKISDRATKVVRVSVIGEFVLPSAP